jgi:uncharacterized protein YPO0396
VVPIPLEGINLVLVELAVIAAGLSGFYVIVKAIRAAYRRGRQMAAITVTLAEIAEHFRPNAGSSLIDVVTTQKELIAQQGDALVNLTKYSHDSVHELRSVLAPLPLVMDRLDAFGEALTALKETVEGREARVRSTDTIPTGDTA